MAADYVEQIRAVQESGPYNLLGWSFGGIAAHEIAVQLQAAGEQVASLVIMDAYPPRQEGSLTPASDEEGLAEEASGSGGRTRLEVPGPDPDLACILDMVRQEAGSLVISDEELVAFARVFRNNGTIIAAHEFQRFNGNLLVIAAAQGRPQDVSAGRWEPYVSATYRNPCFPAGMPICG